MQLAAFIDQRHATGVQKSAKLDILARPQERKGRRETLETRLPQPHPVYSQFAAEQVSTTNSNCVCALLQKKLDGPSQHML